MFENITLQHVTELNMNFAIDGNAPEHIQYKCFLRYYRSLDRELTDDDLIIGASFVYAWMPTMLKFRNAEFGRYVKILNAAKNKVDHRIDDDQITELKGLINNSFVGASKLLHVVNPEKYAIWDSRVCTHFKVSIHRVNDPRIYFDYLDMCERITATEEYESLHQEYINKVGYKVSKMRSIEHLFYNNSENPICAV